MSSHEETSFSFLFLWLKPTSFFLKLLLQLIQEWIQERFVFRFFFIWNQQNCVQKIFIMILSRRNNIILGQLKYTVCYKAHLMFKCAASYASQS